MDNPYEDCLKDKTVPNDKETSQKYAPIWAPSLTSRPTTGQFFASLFLSDLLQIKNEKQKTYGLFTVYS